MNVKESLLVAIGAALVSFSAAADTEYVATSTWFKVETANLSSDPSKGAVVENAGTWTAVPGDVSSECSATLESGKIALDTDYTAPLSFAPVATDEPMASISVLLDLTACDELPTLSSDMTTAICVAPVDDDLKWHFLANSNWVAGASVEDADIGAKFEVTLETVTTNHTIRYSARNVGTGAVTAICDWTACSALTAPITNISFYGATTLGDFAGSGYRKVILDPTVSPENIEVVVIQGKPGSAIVVDKGSVWMTKYMEGSTEKMNEEAQNGLTYLQSYVLGLDPTSMVSKPLVTAAQNSDADTVAFRLGGVTVNSSSGARVSYRVKTLSSPSASSVEATSDAVAAGETITLDVPDANTVKYYRVEVSIE